MRQVCQTLAIILVATTATLAERPPCYQLLPAKTLAYIRIADMTEIGEKFNETSVGKMMQEEELKSLTQHLFEEAETAFEPTAEELGVSLTDILAIPQGELTLAFTAPPNGFPAPVVMIDIEGQEASVYKLLEALEKQIAKDGKLQKGTEAERGTKLTVFQQDADPRFTGIIHFQKDGMLVMTSNLDVAKQILAAWDGDEEQKILEENQDFADVMRNSKGPREATPQIRWFVDPISFAKVAFRGNTGAQMGLAMLPVVGADGLLALGGSVTLASDEYDAFLQTHVITAEPRTGILAAIALQSGDPTPEKWVPHDAASYSTMFWDFDRTRREASVLYDSFRGEDRFQEDVIDRINSALDVDFIEDILGAMAGRVSLATWYPKPTRINGIAFLGGIQLDDEADFEKTLSHVLEHTDPDIEEKQYAGFTIYSAPAEDFGDADEDEDNAFKRVPNQPSFALVKDYLLMANRPEHIERAIVSRSNSAKSLENELDFKLTRSKMRRQPGGKTPGFFSFQRPEEGLRMAYDLATSDAARDRLTSASEDNEFFSRLNDQLQEKPLPPFERLRKHFAPVCSVISADDKGFHYISFGLRRK